jgi:hypothetical protein
VVNTGVPGEVSEKITEVVTRTEGHEILRRP